MWFCSEQLNFPSKQKFKSSGSFGKKMSQATKSQVTLKGSSQMVAEFFNYGINSILYQRGVYPPGMISWKTLFVSSFQIWSWCFRLHIYKRFLTEFQSHLHGNKSMVWLYWSAVMKRSTLFSRTYCHKSKTGMCTFRSSFYVNVNGRLGLILAGWFIAFSQFYGCYSLDWN